MAFPARFLTVVAGVCMVWTPVALAANLTYVSDVITSSQPASVATHTLSFTLTNDVPARGSLFVRFSSASFVLPDTLTLSDISISTEIPTAQALVLVDGAQEPQAGEANVGYLREQGILIFELGSAYESGTSFVVTIGTNALASGVGVRNPEQTGSYRIRIETRDTHGVIDIGTAMVAIVEPVGVYTGEDSTPDVSFESGEQADVVPAGGTVLASVSDATDTNTDFGAGRIIDLFEQLIGPLGGIVQVPANGPLQEEEEPFVFAGNGPPLENVFRILQTSDISNLFDTRVSVVSAGESVAEIVSENVVESAAMLLIITFIGMLWFVRRMFGGL